MTDKDRGLVIDWLEEIVSDPEGWQRFYSSSEQKLLAEDALALLKEQEDRINDLNGFSKDAVPVVRCKNCLYWRKFILNKDGHGACALDGRGHAPDWFCPDGTRRDNNGNE